VPLSPEPPLRFVASRPVLAAALAVGVTGDWLLRGGDWGVGFAVWIAVAVAAAVATERSGAERRARALELAPALLIALGLAWRDSETLRAWNALGTVLWLVVPVVRRSGVPLAATRIVDFAAGAVRAAWTTVRGPVVAGEVPPRAPTAGGRSGRARAVVIGFGLAVALLFVFGGLLRAADPAFEQALGFLWHWNPDVVLSHVALTLVFGWLTVGYLSAARTPREPAAAIRPLDLGTLEIAIPLGALTLLFLAFDLVQVRYLVEGAAVVRETLGLTFAQHARRGFFELIATTGLLLVVLLGAQATLRGGDAPAARAYRLVSAAVLAAALPIPLSAFWRLRLYVDAYGLSEDRFYASAVMAWLVWCLVWLAVSTRRAGAPRFAIGAWIGGFVTLVAVNVVNPDGSIARVNLARARQGVALDTTYLVRLSADAAPVVLAATDEVGSGTRCEIAERWGRPDPDWRTWNLGRERARAAARGAGWCAP
jgi:hypothetical protein